MVDQNGNGTQAAANAAPRLTVLVQYSKDFSFENPNAPRTLGPQQQGPNISVQINVNARQVGPTDYEVNLVLEGGAGEGENTLFKFELNYAGVFRVENIPAEQIQPADHDRGPASAVPVRPADHRRRGAQRRLSPALYRPDRFPGAVPAARRRRGGQPGAA